jgi:hypothetical protein
MDDVGIVGDIHGGAAELSEIVDLVAGRVRHLVFVGDYVNRGKQSAGVMEQLVQLSRSHLPCSFLAGNHDLAFLDCLTTRRLDPFLQMGGAATIRSYLGTAGADVGSELVRAVPPSHKAFLEQLGPHYATDGLLVTHAPPRRPVGPQDGAPYHVAGHILQRNLVPTITADGALIDTGCGTWDHGRLTCLFWPSRHWLQSRPSTR